MNNVKNAITSWDLTIPCSQCKDYKQVKVFLKFWADKWAFQQELSETGYSHFQCRLRLKVRRNGSALNKALNKDKNSITGHWRATSTTVHDGANFNYVMKPERVAGPWTSEDKDITWQLQAFMDRGIEFPYHEKILNWADKLEWRNIQLIYCPQGSKSKTIFGEYLEYINKAVDIPPFRHLEDILAWGKCMIDQDPSHDWTHSPKMFFVDMPH